jgi:hypothetical protein
VLIFIMFSSRKVFVKDLFLGRPNKSFKEDGTIKNKAIFNIHSTAFQAVIAITFVLYGFYFVTNGSNSNIRGINC